ncbi:MAG TPA: response regulator, partial [Myxococcota bacterium]|nr:response regulator [Myxococcota bacterium]
MKRILIVEDEFIIAQNLVQVLEGLGYEVAGHAFDAEEALGLMAVGGVDLAILDINLGRGQSGIELGKVLSERWGIPIVFLTSHTDGGTIREAAAVRPAGYLVKP